MTRRPLPPSIPAVGILLIWGFGLFAPCASQAFALTTAPSAIRSTTSISASVRPAPPVPDPPADSTELEQLFSETTGTAWSIAGSLLAALFVVLLTLYFSRGLVYVLDALAERSAARRLLYKRLVPVVRLMLWAIAIYTIIVGIFGLGARELIAAATAIGVAVGFAAQDLLKNLFGGIVILLDQPFQVGDRINVQDTYGEVVAIGLRSTRIVTPDDNFVTVPNAKLISEEVSNANSGDVDCQVVTDLYLPHTANEARAEELAFEAATNSPYTYLEKPVEVVVNEALNENPYLHLQVKAYVLDTRHERKLRSDVTKRARRAFRAEDLLEPARMSTHSVAPTER